MNVIGEMLGILAGICTAIVFLPQAFQTIRTRNTKGMSLGSYIIYCVGMCLWIGYGVYLGSIQMMFFNGVSLIFALPILCIIIQNKYKE